MNYNLEMITAIQCLDLIFMSSGLQI